MIRILAEIWFVKTSTRIVQYESRVVKSNPVLRCQVLNDLFLKHNSILTNKIRENIEDVDKKIPNTGEVVKNNFYNSKITEIKSKICSIIGLVTSVALYAKVKGIENKIPDITNLATTADLYLKATNIENKISNTSIPITTPEISMQEWKKQKENI